MGGGVERLAEPKYGWIGPGPAPRPAQAGRMPHDRPEIVQCQLSFLDDVATGRRIVAACVHQACGSAGLAWTALRGSWSPRQCRMTSPSQRLGPRGGAGLLLHSPSSARARPVAATPGRSPDRAARGVPPHADRNRCRSGCPPARRRTDGPQSPAMPTSTTTGRLGDRARLSIDCRGSRLTATGQRPDAPASLPSRPRGPLPPCPKRRLVAPSF